MNKIEIEAGRWVDAVLFERYTAILAEWECTYRLRRQRAARSIPISEAMARGGVSEDRWVVEVVGYEEPFAIGGTPAKALERAIGRIVAPAPMPKPSVIDRAKKTTHPTGEYR